MFLPVGRTGSDHLKHTRRSRFAVPSKGIARSIPFASLTPPCSTTTVRRKGKNNRLLLATHTRRKAIRRHILIHNYIHSIRFKSKPQPPKHKEIIRFPEWSHSSTITSPYLPPLIYTPQLATTSSTRSCPHLHRINRSTLVPPYNPITFEKKKRVYFTQDNFGTNYIKNLTIE